MIVAKLPRVGRGVKVGTFVSSSDFSGVDAYTLLSRRGAVEGGVVVAGVGDNPCGSLLFETEGGAAGEPLSVALAVGSEEIPAIAGEALVVGDVVGPAANGRVAKAIAAGGVELGVVEVAASAAGDPTIVNVTGRRTKHS